ATAHGYLSRGLSQWIGPPCWTPASRRLRKSPPGGRYDMSYAYQTEVFPTAIRARASGLVYSMSRVSATFSGFIVAYVLREAGVVGVFGLITTAMIIVIVAIATFGPNVRG